MAVKKKIPMRKCVGCGGMKPKKELIRIADGKKNGRGAYLCRCVECFRKAAKSKGFDRSFKQEIPQEVYDRLEKEMGEIGE